MSSSEKGGKVGGRHIARATVPGAVSVDFDAKPEPLEADACNVMEAAVAPLPEPDRFHAVVRIPSTNEKQRAEVGSSQSSTGSKGRRTTAPATVPGAISSTAENPNGNQQTAAVGSPQTSSKGRRTTAPAPVPGAVSSPAENLNGNQQTAAVGSPQTSSKGHRTTAPATVPGAVSSTAGDPNRPSVSRRRITGTCDESDGAAPLHVPRVRPSEPLTEADGARSGAAGISSTPFTASAVLSLASQDAASKERRSRGVKPSVPGAHHVMPHEDAQDSVASAKDPRLRSAHSYGDGNSLDASPSTSRDSIPKGPRARPFQGSVPDAHHSTPTQDSMASGKDPRGRRGHYVNETPSSNSSVLPNTVDSISADEDARIAQLSVPGAHHVVAPAESQDSVALAKNPRIRHQTSVGENAGSNSSIATKSRHSSAKDRTARHVQPSVPGAHHMTPADESQDSVVASKDPRMRHCAQSGPGSAKSRKADPSAGAAVVLGSTATVIGLDAVMDANPVKEVDDKEDNEKKFLAGVTSVEPGSSNIPDPFTDARGVDGRGQAPAYPLGEKDPFEDASKNAFGQEQPYAGQPSHAAPAAAPMALTTEARGVGVPPDVAYGTIGRGMGSNDDDLAIALAVENEEDRFLPAAIEYDPDSKPPFIHNRRFRLYIITATLLFVIVIISVVLGVLVFQTSPPSDGSSDAPSLAPTSVSDAKYYKQFAQVQGYDDWNFPSDSPQGRAARWIIEEDGLALESEDDALIQRYLLAVIYFTTTENGALPWRSCNHIPDDPTNSTCDFFAFKRNEEDDSVTFEPKPATRWLSMEGACMWAGIVCDNLLNVVAIELFGQNISGTIPTELAALPFVQSIGIAFNAFTGTLPIAFALPDVAAYLLSIEVHGNLLTGPIPSEYFQATLLQNLNIGDNMLTGTLSSEIGLLTNLKGLHMFDNILTGPFPTEIGNLPFLSFARFHENIFTGTIPSELGKLELLQEMTLNSNRFIGTIPTELGQLVELLDMKLSWSSLTGTIPSEIYSLTKLTILDLFQTNLNGTIATEIGLLTDLVELRLSRAEFTGTVPVEIANLTRLTLAWFHVNKFVGSIPSEICKLRALGLYFLQSDCFPDNDGPNPCDCCTACCDRETEVCLVIDMDTV